MMENNNKSIFYWREYEEDDNSIAKERVLKGGLFSLI
jgi:hypothetical protein